MAKVGEYTVPLTLDTEPFCEAMAKTIAALLAAIIGAYLVGWMFMEIVGVANAE